MSDISHLKIGDYVVWDGFDNSWYGPKVSGILCQIQKITPKQAVIAGGLTTYKVNRVTGRFVGNVFGSVTPADEETINKISAEIRHKNNWHTAYNKVSKVQLRELSIEQLEAILKIVEVGK